MVKVKTTKRTRTKTKAQARATVAPAEDAEYIQKANAVARLGMSAKTLERMVREGKLERFERMIPGRRGRRAVFYLRAQLDELAKPSPVALKVTEPEDTK